jgi:hypothetical protein
MNPRLLGTALFVAAGIRLAVGCINTEVVDGPPQQLPAALFKTLRPGPSLADAQAKFARIIGDYEDSPADYPEFEIRIDYAAALIYMDRAADAISVLQAIEVAFPGRYATASNLGTAYELVGDVPNAKTWIKRGIKRKPDSHQGTEWLHVAILDAKLKLKNNPEWLEKHSVLDGDRKRKATDVERALEYQLNERLYFIKDNDPIMCDLFYEAARFTTNDAKRSYFIQQAGLFGSIRTQQLAALQSTAFLARGR